MMVSCGAMRANVSIWLSVSSPAIPPLRSHSWGVNPSVSARYSFISASVISPLRLGDRRHSAVVSSVPLPSVSILPPSRTNPMRLTYSAFSLPLSTRWVVMRLSLSAANFIPQALNLKSSDCRQPSFSIVMGPKSRAHVSLVGISSILTLEESNLYASIDFLHMCSGQASITHSRSDMARTISAKHSRASSSIYAQSVYS